MVEKSTEIFTEIFTTFSIPSYVDKFLKLLQESLASAIVKVDSRIGGSILQDEDDVGPAMTWGTAFEALQVKDFKTDIVTLPLILLVICCTTETANTQHIQRKMSSWLNLFFKNVYAKGFTTV